MGASGSSHVGIAIALSSGSSYIGEDSDLMIEA